MDGFDPRFTDFPDYIIGITKEIWEDRGISTLHSYYAPDIVVRSPGSVVVGNEGVIAATLATLAEFPDRKLFGEDVIWSGTPETGLLSSHRILSTATHTGDGVYGRATGKRLAYRIIADCHAKANVIDDEWLIRDQGAIVRQLGLDPAAYARDLIAREGGPDRCVRPFTPAIDKEGPYKGSGNDNEWGAQYAGVVTDVMKGGLDVVTRSYDRACQLHYPGGVSGVSHPDADRFWIGLRASFPDATFKIEHQIGREDAMMPPRAALRFSLTGRHSGWGAFGPPTGADVHIMAAAHAEFGPWGLRREVVLFDETAIWKQIALATG
ncbi:MAG: ester cyclase [Pseudomonadota bacterium]